MPHYLMRTVNVSSLRSKILTLLALSATLGLTLGRAASQLDSLLKDSPFGSAKSTQASDAGNQPVEFRGVSEENGQVLFSIFDTATKRSRWVTLNDTSGDVVVKSYDAEAHTVALEQNGRTLSLTLKSGPKIAQQNIPPPMPPGLPGANGTQGQIMPNGAARGPEAQRLQQIAEEIRRRRALRQQAPQSPQMPMPSPNAVPGMGGPMPTPGTGTNTGGPVPMPGTGSGPVPTGTPNPGSGPVPTYPQQQ